VVLITLLRAAQEHLGKAMQAALAEIADVQDDQVQAVAEPELQVMMIEEALAATAVMDW
jgi:cytochrome P450